MGVRILTVDQSVAELVKQNGGYCPCMIERTFDTRCMCKLVPGRHQGPGMGKTEIWRWSLPASLVSRIDCSLSLDVH